VVIGAQLVEIQVEKLHCISRAVPNLPISVEDAARSEEEVARAKAVSSWLQKCRSYIHGTIHGYFSRDSLLEHVHDEIHCKHASGTCFYRQGSSSFMSGRISGWTTG
jgi:hypothetical protein